MLPLVDTQRLLYDWRMKSKHKRTLAAIYTAPTPASIPFAGILALFTALGAEIEEKEGSRIKVTLNGITWRAHRPHPGKDAKKYQVEEAKEFLNLAGVAHEK